MEHESIIGALFEIARVVGHGVVWLRLGDRVRQSLRGLTGQLARALGSLIVLLLLWLSAGIEEIAGISILLRLL